jgi:hypothetical protein
MCLGFGLTLGALTTISGTLAEGVAAGGGEELCCADAAVATTIANATAKTGVPVSWHNLLHQSFRSANPAITLEP